MHPNPDPTVPSQPAPITSFWVLGARVTWLFFGPIVLLGVTYGIVSAGAGWLTGFDLAFAIVAALMLFGRWVDQRAGSATTATGEPATAADFRRYLAIAVPLIAAVWLAANFVGNHVLA